MVVLFEVVNAANLGTEAWFCKPDVARYSGKNNLYGSVPFTVPFVMFSGLGEK